MMHLNQLETDLLLSDPQEGTELLPPVSPGERWLTLPGVCTPSSPDPHLSLGDNWEWHPRGNEGGGEEWSARGEEKEGSSAAETENKKTGNEWATVTFLCLMKERCMKTTSEIH